MSWRKTTYLTTLAACALALGCDQGEPDATSGEELAFAGFALTGDDESDDGFTDGANTVPLQDAVGSDAQPDDGSERLRADETDPAGFPPEGADYVYRTVLMVWGQARLNPELEGTPTEWKGQIATDLGKLKALRVVRFERGVPEEGDAEGQNDHLVPDDDPQAVSFETVTTTHHDGVLLLLALPREEVTLNGDIVFATEHYTKSIPLADLLAGEALMYDADDLGNSLLVVSHPAHRCPHGMLRLQWERKNERGGVFGGKVFDAQGEVAGTLVGIWGQIEGKRRFKGSYLGAAGEFRGTLRGTWAPFPPDSGEVGGTFRGVWQSQRRVHGVLGGVYRVSDEPEKGSAAGFWRAACRDMGTLCQGDLAFPPPPAADCSCQPDPENDSDDACSCAVPPPPSCVPPEPATE